MRVVSAGQDVLSFPRGRGAHAEGVGKPSEYAVSVLQAPLVNEHAPLVALDDFEPHVELAPFHRLERLYRIGGILEGTEAFATLDLPDVQRLAAIGRRNATTLGAEDDVGDATVVSTELPKSQTVFEILEL